MQLNNAIFCYFFAVKDMSAVCYNVQCVCVSDLRAVHHKSGKIWVNYTNGNIWRAFLPVTLPENDKKLCNFLARFAKANFMKKHSPKIVTNMNKIGIKLTHLLSHYIYFSQII